MEKWTEYPGDAFDFSGDKLNQAWDSLHAGNKQPLPADEKEQEVWRAYHEGRYFDAYEQGKELGGEGLISAAFAATMSAYFLESDESTKLKVFELAMEVAEQAVEACPDNPNAHYMLAISQGRYSQFINIVEALAKGFGGKMKTNLKKAIELEPNHAEAHLAFAAWNAEIIDKVGGIMGGLTYAASKDNAKKHFATATKLAPEVPIVHLEKAKGVVLMSGRSGKREARQLIEKVIDMQPLDAMQWLDRENAKRQLADL